METVEILHLTRLIIGIIILSYASYTDIKTRMASNMNWLVMAAVGGILILIQYFTVGFENLYLLLFIPIMIALVYVFFQLRLIFGGADAKALMAIAILAPLEPTITQFPLWKGSLMPFSWSIFTNSIIIFILIPISLLIYNIIKRNIQFPYALLGYKMNINKAKENFVWPLETIKDGKRRLVYMPKDFDVEEELKKLENAGIKDIWVTPKIPFMIPLLIGFICAFILGDILFYLMNLLT